MKGNNNNNIQSDKKMTNSTIIDYDVDDDGSGGNGRSSVLATIKGTDAKKLLQELENGSSIKFSLTTTDQNNNNNDPVIELYRDD